MIMKLKLLLFLAVMCACFTASSQFRRSSDHKVYPYTYTLRSNDVFIIGRIIPDTNYNVSVSNMWSAIGGPTNTGIAGQALHATGTGLPTKWDYVNQALTNSNPVVPDFSLPVNCWKTNQPFLFLSPANVDPTGKKIQVTDVIVTNSTSSAIAVTFPASIHVTGVAFITNLTVFHFRQYGREWTNCACEPVW